MRAAVLEFGASCAVKVHRWSPDMACPVCWRAVSWKQKTPEPGWVRGIARRLIGQSTRLPIMPPLVYMSEMILGPGAEGNRASHPLIASDVRQHSLGSPRRSLDPGRRRVERGRPSGYGLLSSEGPAAQGEDARLP